MAWYKVDHLLMPDGCLEVEVENSFQDPFPAQHNIIGVSIQHNEVWLRNRRGLTAQKRTPLFRALDPPLIGELEIHSYANHAACFYNPFQLTWNISETDNVTTKMLLNSKINVLISWSYTMSVVYLW